MRRPLRYTPSGKAILLSLVVLSVILLLLPRAWTGRLMSLVQIVAPFQAATTGAADLIGGPGEPDAAPVSGDVYQQLRRELVAREHQVAALTAQLRLAEQANELLTAIRLRGVGGSGIGAEGRLIPARVIAQDMVAWRSSRLIDAGTLRGVHAGAAVTSREFSINRGTEDGIRTGLGVLLAETLLGTIESTGTHTARVKLLSDVTTERRVRIGRFNDDGFQLAEPGFWLVGRGRGRMEIHDVDRRLEEDGTIAVGDTVLSDPTSTLLPTALTIGRVTGIEPDRNNPLLVILHVEPPIPETTLGSVYVFAPDTEPGA